jgi:hypothetical protein
MNAQSPGLAQFLVDERGNRTAVLLDLRRYQELLEAEEDLDDIRAYDEAKAQSDEVIPWEQAVKEIEDMRE